MSIASAVQSFRGLRATVLHPSDQHCAVLERTLRRLGLAVEVLDTEATELLEASGIAATDVLFIDADAPSLPTLAAGGPPIIAVIGHETPSRLVRVYEMQASGFIMKPVRSQGVYTALFFAINAHRRQRQLLARLAEIERRHAGRRHVVRAVLALMDHHGIDEDEAFRRLRRESMAQRLTIEDFSRRFVETAGTTSRRRSVGG